MVTSNHGENSSFLQLGRKPPDVTLNHFGLY